jgi:hypothetical protein
LQQGLTPGDNNQPGFVARKSANLLHKGFNINHSGTCGKVGVAHHTAEVAVRQPNEYRRHTAVRAFSLKGVEHIYNLQRTLRIQVLGDDGVKPEHNRSLS